MNVKKRIKIYFRAFIILNIVNDTIPFLYSKNQTINLVEGKEKYDLKFKVGSFYSDKIFLYSPNSKKKIYTNLDNCRVTGNEMTCELSKEKIYKFNLMNYNYSIMTFDYDYYYKYGFYSYVGEIFIRNIIPSQNIY